MAAGYTMGYTTLSSKTLRHIPEVGYNLGYTDNPPPPIMEN